MKRKTREEKGERLLSVDLKDALYEKFMSSVPVGADIKVIASIALELWCEMTHKQRHEAMIRLGPDKLARKIEQAFEMVAQLEGRQVGQTGKRRRDGSKPS